MSGLLVIAEKINQFRWENVAISSSAIPASTPGYPWAATARTCIKLEPARLVPMRRQGMSWFWTNAVNKAAPGSWKLSALSPARQLHRSQ